MEGYQLLQTMALNADGPYVYYSTDLFPSIRLEETLALHLTEKRRKKILNLSLTSLTLSCKLIHQYHDQCVSCCTVTRVGFISISFFFLFCSFLISCRLVLLLLPSTFCRDTFCSTMALVLSLTPICASLSHDLSKRHRDG